MENKRRESILANKIIDMFRDENVEPSDALGAVMVVARFLILDDKESAEAIKKAFCKFIDSTIGIQTDD
jgi:hypothetical protein